MGKFRVEKNFGGECLKKGHRKFCVPGNVILQKVLYMITLFLWSYVIVCHHFVKYC